MSKRKREALPGEFVDAEGNRLPKYMQVVLSRLRKGEVLCKEISPLAPQPRFFLEPSAKEISHATAHRVIQSGHVIAGRDGLFSSGDDQTWRLRHG